jgi:hypothetical protein
MSTTHLASSAAARPRELGPSMTTDDDLRVVGQATVGSASDVADPAHAARHVVAALLENRPYLVTHGAMPAAASERFDAIRAAFGRANE